MTGSKRGATGLREMTGCDVSREAWFADDKTCRRRSKRDAQELP